MNTANNDDSSEAPREMNTPLPEWAIHAADFAMMFCDCAAKDDTFRDELARLMFNTRKSCAPIPGHPPRWAIDAARELHSSWWNVESAAHVIARHSPTQ